jgi:ABC-type transporter MlaC component
MKTLLALLLLTLPFYSCDTLSRVQLPTTITEAEAAQGIREALDKGVGRGISQLAREDGFLGSTAYKLFLPADAQRIESVLRQVGMGSLVDRTIIQINRAAENAVSFASPIFLDAIREMTLTDALAIVRGPRDAATQYFRQKTTEKLVAAFTPVIKSSLEKFSATKYYSDMINTYNNFPTTQQKLNPDLPSYVVEKTVNALFDQIAQEEANIRANPVARTTEILKRVFGWAAR